MSQMIPMDEEPPFYSMLHNPVLIGMCCVLFAPIGLVLTWLNPNWLSKTKWIITGCIVVYGFFCALGYTQENKGMKKQLMTANQMWADGDKNGAFFKYQDLIFNQRGWLDTNIEVIGIEHGPIIYGRSIDHCVTLGDLDKASFLIKKAKHDGLFPLCETEQGKQLCKEIK